jgi:hypothetical protein
MKTLEKDPAARHQHMSEVEAELGAINPEALMNVTKIPAVGRAGSTGRSKLRSNRSLAPKAGEGAFQITNPGNIVQSETAYDLPPPPNNKKKIGIAVGVLAVAGIGVAVLAGGGKKDAPAPAAVAAPALVPAKPAEPGVAAVKIDVTSTPSGASVVRAEDGAFLGRTPYHASFPKGANAMTLVVRHEGFKDQRIVIPLLEDGKSDVTLEAAAPAAAAPVQAAAPKPGSHGKPSGGKPKGGAASGDKKKRGWGDLVDF